MKKDAAKGELLVAGEILFDKGARSFSGATVYVRLEDVSNADAPSRVVAEDVLRDVSYRAGSKAPLEFKLQAKPPDKHASYNVRVHVDLDGDGEISVGDYITMQSYPVLTDDHPTRVSVLVQKVT